MQLQLWCIHASASISTVTYTFCSIIKTPNLSFNCLLLLVWLCLLSFFFTFHLHLSMQHFCLCQSYLAVFCTFCLTLWFPLHQYTDATFIPTHHTDLPVMLKQHWVNLGSRAQGSLIQYDIWPSGGSSYIFFVRVNQLTGRLYHIERINGWRWNLMWIFLKLLSRVFDNIK